MSNNINGASESSSSPNFKDIYLLIEKLCKSILGPGIEAGEAIRYATSFIAHCPSALSPALPYDEVTLVTVILKYINSQKDSGIVESTATSLTQLAEPTKEQLFRRWYEGLKNTHIDANSRNAMLTLLFLLKGMKYTQSIVPTPKVNAGSIQSRNEIQSNTNLRELFVRDTVTNSDVTKSVNTITNCYLSAPAQTHHLITATESNVIELTSSLQSLHVAGVTNNYNNNKNRDLNASLENDLVQNVIYAFTGVPGKYLRKDVITKKFKLDPRAKSLNIVQAGMLLRLAQLGYFYELVQGYTDPQNGICALGMLGQGFVYALKQEITQYYGMVAMLQAQLNKQSTTPRSCYNPSGQRSENLTLLKLLVWYVEPLQRLQWLASIAASCKEKKGGDLASTVHNFLHNGDPIVKALAKELLLAICGPLNIMLMRWLLDGEIHDPHGEFFIECLDEIGPDRLWYDKYRVRKSMLPNFISTELANKILVTGKSINFLRHLCEDKAPIRGREELRHCIEENAEQIFSRTGDTKLHALIDSVYLNTSMRVLEMALGPHKLLKHLEAMRRYLLLGQGDFVSVLMENLKYELDRPGKELFTYDLSSIMDSAIRATSLQIEDPEILNYLDVRLMEPCEGDLGWDIVSLQYTVHGPLETMLEPSMGIYQVLFKPLWRMKHMEFVLSSIVWIQQRINVKLLRPLKNDLESVFYRLHLFTSEMMHFIYQMQYYILFEVIECSWIRLQAQVEQAKTLDEILEAHNDFLNVIKCGAFLDKSSVKLSHNIETIYEGITHLEVWQKKFYEICFNELNARKNLEEEIIKSEKAGKFGLTTERQLDRDQELKIFRQQVNSCSKSLEHIASAAENAVRSFLLTLNSHNEPNLQIFATRLDFNEYYKKRDQRLCVPLTFEHMRMSNTFYNGNNHNNNNKSILGASRYSSIN